jgi:hypothetical protein
LKLLEENTGNVLEDISIGNAFLNFFIVLLGESTLWHLQKFMQNIKYIILEFTPRFSPSPHSWNSFNRYQGNAFLNSNSIAQEIRARVDKWNYIKLKSSTHRQKQLPESRDNPKNGREILASYLLDEGLISKIHKELKKLKTKRIIQLINWQMN